MEVLWEVLEEKNARDSYRIRREMNLVTLDFLFLHVFIKSAPGNPNYYTVKMNLINPAAK